MPTFSSTVWGYYHAHKRAMPWRDDTRPYYIVVSELMLQQTQVDRVVPKFTSFVAKYNDFSSLAQAPLADVITTWQGLGYNRRAKYLQQLAQTVISDYNGQLPADIATLEQLPGIGPATARSIAAFAFNQPVVFIETNIRSVFIHHFFADQSDVTDAQLLPLVEQTLDHHNPREWYWALMDYGSWLKKTHSNPSRQSKHHTKQSPFIGSNRQKRGQILKLLSNRHQATLTEIATQLSCDKKVARQIITTMQKDGLITYRNNLFRLPQ